MERIGLLSPIEIVIGQQMPTYEELSSLRRSVPVRTSAFAHAAVLSREPVPKGRAGE